MSIKTSHRKRKPPEIDLIRFLDDNCSYRKTSSGADIVLDDECPWCGRAGKVYISIKQKVGICFYCDERFNAYKFIQAHSGNLSGYGIVDVKHKFIEKEIDTEKVVASVWLPNVIKCPEHVREYLKDRGVSEQMIQQLGITYSNKNTMVNDVKKYTKGRVIIPVYGVDKNLVGWVGRDTTGKSGRKYLFPDGFKTSEFLYNAHNIQSNYEYLVICEGVFDVIGWFNAGVKSVVATFGKKISPKQMEFIYKINPKRIFNAWDKDAYDEKYNFATKFQDRFDVRLVNLERDADESTKDELINALVNAKTFSWEDSLLSML